MYDPSMYDQAFWLSTILELGAVGIVSAKVKIPTVILALVVTFIAITWFNFQSPITASYFSQFSIMAFVSWLVYIWLVRCFFSPFRKRQS
jgi:ABC-type dipeptide/oligopeptide/nickel transport system permease subunit